MQNAKLWRIRATFIVVGTQHWILLSHERHDFRKTFIELKIYFGFLYYFCLKNFTLEEEFSKMSP
jgi:hypothetical protein